MATSSSSSAIDSLDHLLSKAGLRRGQRRAVSGGIERRAAWERQPAKPRQLQRSVSRNRVEVVRVAAFSEIDWLIHGFSTRTGGMSKVYRSSQRSGELNLGFTASEEEANVAANRERFFAAVAGNPQFPVVTLRQIHSSLLRRVTAQDAKAKAVLKADGMMTDAPGLLLAIQTADCIPVLIADRKRRAVAGFHAGWRGTLMRIVENGVGKMRLEYGSKPEDLVAAIGPGIGQCCYAVGDEAREEFESQFAYAYELFFDGNDIDRVKEKYPLLFLTARPPGHGSAGAGLHLDLVEANRRQLLDAGLREDAISVVGDCTNCRTDRYFSYRAEHGFTGRMFSVIGVRA